jgi:AcrR family transcriptional regulator
VTPDDTTAWKADPLPGGRHKLPPEVVKASQRERLVRAMIEVVNEEGYEATTVPKVVAAARVSTNAFYSFFDDKAACFIEICEIAGNALFDGMAENATAPDWITALERGMGMYLRWWQESAALTRAYMIDFPSVGRRSTEERDRQHERFKTIMRYSADWARQEDPMLPPISEVALDAAVSAPTDLIGREVRAGRLDQLTDLEDDILFLIIKLLSNDITAQRARDSRAERNAEARAPGPVNTGLSSE